MIQCNYPLINDYFIVKVDYTSFTCAVLQYRSVYDGRALLNTLLELLKLLLLLVLFVRGCGRRSRCTFNSNTNNCCCAAGGANGCYTISESKSFSLFTKI